MFRNTLRANDKYPVQDCENLSFPIQIQLSLKPETFCDFFSYFWNVHEILNILKKKIIVIANLLRNLQAVKNLVNLLSKKNTVSEHSLTVNILKGLKHL